MFRAERNQPQQLRQAEAFGFNWCADNFPVLRLVAATQPRSGGGVITSTLMELLVYPAIFYVWRARRIGKAE